MNILIVDDSLTIRRMIKHVLESNFEGAKLIEATDGKAAFHELTRNKIDVIITDIEMGENDGDTLINRIKSNKILKNKKIIVYSSKDEFKRTLIANSLENVYFINKSEPMDVLIKKLKEIIL